MSQSQVILSLFCIDGLAKGYGNFSASQYGYLSFVPCHRLSPIKYISEPRNPKFLPYALMSFVIWHVTPERLRIRWLELRLYYIIPSIEL